MIYYSPHAHDTTHLRPVGYRIPASSSRWNTGYRPPGRYPRRGPTLSGSLLSPTLRAGRDKFSEQHSQEHHAARNSSTLVSKNAAVFHPPLVDPLERTLQQSPLAPRRARNADGSRAAGDAERQHANADGRRHGAKRLLCDGRVRRLPPRNHHPPTHRAFRRRRPATAAAAAAAAAADARATAARAPAGRAAARGRSARCSRATLG